MKTCSDPVRFKYVLDRIVGLNLDDMYLISERRRVANEELAQRTQLWRDVYAEIESRDDWKEFYRWLKSLSDEYLSEMQLCRAMLFLFNEFSTMNVSPFNRRDTHFITDPPQFDWSKLPDELHFLVKPAEQYGGIQFPAEVAKCLNELTEEEERKFNRLIVEIEKRPGQIDRFLDKYRMTEHPEARHVYFLWSLLAQYADSRDHE